MFDSLGKERKSCNGHRKMLKKRMKTTHVNFTNAWLPLHFYKRTVTPTFLRYEMEVPSLLKT